MSFSAQENVVTKFKPLTKTLYDSSKDYETKVQLPNEESLPELIIRNFDDEQIWQQLELNNDFVKELFLKKIAAVSARKNIEFIPQSNEAETIDEPFEEDDSEPVEEDIDDEDDGSSRKRNRITTKKIRPSIVDDDFFKVDELEDFLKAEEEKEASDFELESDDSEDIDFFRDPDDGPDDKSGRKAMYKDFFDPPHDFEEEGDLNGEESDNGDMDICDDRYDTRDIEPAKEQNEAKLLLADSSDDEVAGAENGVKSNFEVRQERVS
ncbi:MAG: hypothetical protein ACKE51_09520 [Methylococcaceae bacterium]